MSKENRLHITEIDEFLADLFSKSKNRPIKLVVIKNGDQGYIKTVLHESGDEVEGEGIDFELSPGESLDLENVDIRDFLMKPVYTSSAYELFDFIFMHFNSFICLVDFRENAWQVKILKTG